MSAAERVRKTRAENDHQTWQHRAPQSSRQVWRREKPDWKVLKSGGHKRGGVRETTPSRNFAIRGSNKGWKLRAEWWGEYKFTQISMGLFLEN